VGDVMAGGEGILKEGQTVAQTRGQADKATDRAGQEPGSASAWSFYLVRIAILSVTGAFIVVMVLFAFLEVFNSENAANITAALGSLFGVVGTLVGAYFGIKASSDAQDSSAATAKQALSDQKDTSKDTVQKAAAVASETSQKAAEASQKAAETAAETLKRAKVASPMTTMALATLIPVAGGASLLVLRHYLRRVQDAA
jgi:hypothetical protein